MMRKSLMHSIIINIDLRQMTQVYMAERMIARRLCVMRYYFVAASIFFMLANMKIPDTTQMAMSTVQRDQSGILIQRSPGTDTR